MFFCVFVLFCFVFLSVCVDYKSEFVGHDAIHRYVQVEVGVCFFVCLFYFVLCFYLFVWIIKVSL